MPLPPIHHTTLALCLLALAIPCASAKPDPARSAARPIGQGGATASPWTMPAPAGKIIWRHTDRINAVNLRRAIVSFPDSQ